MWEIFWGKGDYVIWNSFSIGEPQLKKKKENSQWNFPRMGIVKGLVRIVASSI